MKYGAVKLVCTFPKYMQVPIDCVGEYKGAPCIIDFKQTNRPQKERMD